jgi:adenosylmethionine-8-amino-7-oxononanoate aminotransferase
MAAPQPLAASSTGLTFTLSNGRSVLDGVSGGAAVACLGAYNPDLVTVMAEQAAQLPYTYHQVLGNAPAEKLAAFLVDKSRGAFAAAAFLGSGSEAVEASIKLVRQYWVEKGEPQRKYIVARTPSYHGNTLGALGVSIAKH